MAMRRRSGESSSWPSARPAQARPTSSPHWSVPAGPASSSSSGSSRPTGLVSRRTERHGVGRPRHLYDVTASAQQLFPANYDGLAAGLIAAIDSIGGRELVDRVFETRRAQTAERIRRRLDESVGDEAPFFDRVRELAVIQDEQGYLCGAELSADGTIRMREHNCAIFHVATDDPAACEAELQLFRDVLGADIIRETHIASGDRCCTYRISARPD